MTVCTQCGNDFECRADAPPDEPCWCTRLPALPPQAYVVDKNSSAAGSCFCPDCLRSLLEKEKTDATSP